MAAYRQDYDLRHLQADCQEPGSAPGPYARFLTVSLKVSRVRILAVGCHYLAFKKLSGGVLAWLSVWS